MPLPEANFLSCHYYPHELAVPGSGFGVVFGAPEVYTVVEPRSKIEVAAQCLEVFHRHFLEAQGIFLKGTTMSRFNQIKNPSDNPQLGTLYKEILEHGLGADVPGNWFTAQSERPDILNATWGLFKGILLQGELPPTVKEMIAMTIAMQNNCRYCTVAHTNALESMGVPKEVIQSCAKDPDLADVPPPQRAMLKFGLKTARDPQSVTDEDLRTLRDHGLTDGEIMEVAMVAAAANFLDTWADVSAIAVEGEETS